MTEKDFIAKIKQLRQIKPRKDWVLLTKSSILNQGFRRAVPTTSGIGQIFRWLVFQPKMAYASLIILTLFLSAFSFAQNSLPGEILYPIKKITEKGQAIFVSEAEKSKFNLELIDKRLEELTKVAETNQVKKLAPAINEYQASISEVAKNLTKEEIKNNPNEIKKIVKEVKSIEKKTAEIESLGIQIDENIELDSALVQLIKLQVDDLEKRTLTPGQAESIGEIKADIEAGQYAEALEKLLNITKE